MKKILTFALSFLLATLLAHAKDQWIINGNPYDVDTVEFPQQVGPGIRYAQYALPAFPLRVSVIHVDLTNPHNALETAMPDFAINRDVPAQMALRYSRENHQVVGAINSDLSSLSGEPVNSGQFMNGEMIVSPSGMMAFALDERNRPFIDRFRFNGQMAIGGTTLRISNVNATRYVTDTQSSDVVVLYTDRYYTDTNLSSGGKKMVISPKEGRFLWQSNAPIHATIDSIFDNDGHTAIAQGKAVVWIKGSAEEALAHVAAGDEVVITLGVSLDNGSMAHIEQLAGGMDMFVARSGQMGDTWEERHPRSIIGFNDDSTQVHMFVIDGRQSASAGATLSECYHIVRQFGVSTAINLDGGGSSCMVVDGQVVNSPSDGTVRPVGNCFLALSKAPTDFATDSICFEPRDYVLPAAGQLPLRVWSYNRYGDLTSKQLDGCTFACDEQLGSVDAQGHFTAGRQTATGYISATCGHLTTRQWVRVVPTPAIMLADSVTLDANHSYTVQLRPANGDLQQLPISPEVVNWESTDETVCVVDKAGIIRARNDGRAWVIGRSDDFADTLLVKVENPKARITTVENAPIDPATWKVTQSGGTGRTVTPTENGMSIDFTTSSSRAPYIRLSKNVDFYGLPRSLRLRFSPEGIVVSKVTISTHANAGSQTITAIDIADSLQSAAQTLEIPVDTFCDSGDLSIYPIGLNYINFIVSPLSVGSPATLRIPGIELIYDCGAQGDVNGDGEVDVADANRLINMILLITTPDVTRGDLNGDGAVDVTDLNLLINILLKK